MGALFKVFDIGNKTKFIAILAKDTEQLSPVIIPLVCL